MERPPVESQPRRENGELEQSISSSPNSLTTSSAREGAEAPASSLVRAAGGTAAGYLPGQLGAMCPTLPHLWHVKLACFGLGLVGLGRGFVDVVEVAELAAGADVCC